MSKRILSDGQRAEYRDGKRAEQRALVEAACREMLSSEGWRRFAETRATFHRYSFGNCMLFAHQMPAATQVAGFKSWQELGRQVRKGEPSIRILAPMSVKERDEQGNETHERRTFFRAVPVFDVSQTDGEPLAEAPREPITGDSHAGYVERLEQYARSLGYTVEREALKSAGGGNDGLKWPHCDGLSWPHLRPIGRRRFDALVARAEGGGGDGFEDGTVRADQMGSRS
jgi:N-terminal domain of anti-restriction factor ArdC